MPTYTQLEVDNIISSSGNFTNLTCTSGTISTNLTLGTNNLTTTNTLNIINSANLYLWSNFR